MPATVIRDGCRLSAADDAAIEPAATNETNAAAAIASSVRPPGMVTGYAGLTPPRSARLAETICGPAGEHRRLDVRPARVRRTLALEVAGRDRLAGGEPREDRLDRREEHVRDGDVGR